MIETALKIIEKAFVGKTDKAGKPYIEHLKRVSESCPNIGVNNEVKVIALLHDVLEDCPEWSEKALRTFFTDGVVDSVIALTHKQGQTYDEYITQVLEDGWATIVKKHDLEDNMNITRLKQITKEDLERLKKYHDAYVRIVATPELS
jgi:(p)ppGpp synthase/HD superfamily hydrolase